MATGAGELSTDGDHDLLPSPGLQSFWPSDIAHAREDTQADVGHPGSHYGLARSLFARYQHTSNSAYLTECIDIFRLLRDRASTDELEQMTLDLGDCLFAEHRRTGHIEPIEEMIAIHRHISTLGLSQRLNDLECQHAKTLLMRGEFTGDMTDVVRAKKMVDALKPNPKDLADHSYLVVLALYHRTISKTTSQGDLKTLRPLRDSMVERLVFRGVSSARSDMLASCLTLCNVIYAVDGSLIEALGVVDIAKSALEQPITPSADLFDVLCSLSLLHITLGRRCSDINYMNAAKQWIDQALCLVQDSSINRGEAHHALGRWLLLSQYYFQIGHHSMFEDAANHFRQALDCCPRLHVNRHRYMSVFMVSVRLRVEHTGSMRALNEAIELFDAHRDLATTNPTLAVNASGVLIDRVMAGRLRTASKQQLLERAVSVLQSALMNTTDDSPYRITIFRALSNAYTVQSSLGLAVDISTHILAARSSAAMLIEDPEEQALCKVELARVLLHVAQSTSDLEALHESMVLLDDIAENSTSSLSGNEFNRADLTSLQAHSYLVRNKLLGAESDLVTANHMFDSSFSGVAYRIPRRLRRSLEWADAARFIADRALEMRAYHQAIDTLPQLTYLGTDIGTQIEAVQLAEGLASRAAALALDLDDPRGAIELLEQTRGVVWSQSLHVRSRPEAIPPQYATVFERITGSLKAAEGPAERRQKVAELEDLISQIRLVDGYKRFLLPRLYSELAACATFGTVIVAVPSDAFTDVVAIRDPMSAPTHLRLPALKLSRLQALTAKLKSTSDRARNSSLQEHRKMKMVGVPNAQQTLVNEYMSVLEELWTGLVHPVVTHLKIQPASVDGYATRPRLWWCPTGPFAELPLHAAGIYRGDRQDNLSNYVVSSYTPTLTALVHAQEEHSGSTHHEATSFLLVALSDVEGLPSLPNARVEASLVQEATFVSNTTTLYESNASIAAVLDRLPNASALHLACHGHQSQDDPLASGFSLHDGRLTLEHLMRLHLPHAELAYLSACETASTDEYQPDEAINLAATMLFVGFKSVIATMWSMNDLDGPFVAQRVYKAIFREGKLDLKAVPYALDAAVRELRDSGVHPSRWATYVHIGA